MLRRNFRNLALFATPLIQPPNGQGRSLGGRRGCRAARPVIKYPQPREAVRRADDDQIDRTLHCRGGSREEVVRRSRGCIASQTRGGRYEFESCSSGRPRARHRRGNFARRRRGGGAGHGARCLPDRLRKLSGGCAAAHLRLLGRGGEGRHCLGRQPLSTTSRRCAWRRCMPGRSARAAGRSSSSRRRQPFFPAVTRNSVEGGSWGEGMGFRVVAAGGASLRPPADKRLPPRAARAQTAGMTLEYARPTTGASRRTRRPSPAAARPRR